MIDLGRLRSARMRSDPYPLAVVDGLLPQPVARVLCDEFPVEGFHLDTRSGAGAEKRYRSYNLGVIERGVPQRPAWDALSPAWREFLDALLGEPYLDAVAETTAVALRDCEAEVRLCRYEAGCWIDPHTDRPDKRLTQVIYLNPGWNPDWGGNLLVLRSREVSDVATTVVPRLGTSVLIRPSASSWHAVQPVAGTAAVQRRSVLVHWTPVR
jgi:SM-20-related protein